MISCKIPSATVLFLVDKLDLVDDACDSSVTDLCVKEEIEVPTEGVMEKAEEHEVAMGEVQDISDSRSISESGLSAQDLVNYLGLPVPTIFVKVRLIENANCLFADQHWLNISAKDNDAWWPTTRIDLQRTYVNREGELQALNPKLKHSEAGSAITDELTTSIK